MQLDKEAWLIKRVQRGDVKAYETLIGAYEKLIYNLCLKILKDQEESADAAQEVCLKIWRQIGSFKGTAKFSTWVYRMTTNQCLDMLRKNKRKETEVSLYLSEEEGKEEKMTDAQSIWEDMSEHLARKELGVIVMQGLEEIKEEYRIILILREMEERSYEEIAQILDLSLGTVKSRLSRARQALKKILQQDKEPYRSFFRHKKQ